MWLVVHPPYAIPLTMGHMITYRQWREGAYCPFVCGQDSVASLGLVPHMS